MTDQADEILARRAAAGDRNAFSDLLERHYGLIYRVAARMLGDGVEAEDLAQDVLRGTGDQACFLRRAESIHHLALPGGGERGAGRHAPQPQPAAETSRNSPSKTVLATAKSASAARIRFGCNKCWAS